MLRYTKELGETCKQYRQEQEIKQEAVAFDTGYGPGVISAFETGRNNNAVVLLWYFVNGMTVDYLKKNGVI